MSLNRMKTTYVRTYVHIRITYSVRIRTYVRIYIYTYIYGVHVTNACMMLTLVLSRATARCKHLPTYAHTEHLCTRVMCATSQGNSFWRRHAVHGTPYLLRIPMVWAAMIVIRYSTLSALPNIHKQSKQALRVQNTCPSLSTTGVPTSFPMFSSRRLVPHDTRCKYCQSHFDSCNPISPLATHHD